MIIGANFIEQFAVKFNYSKNTVSFAQSINASPGALMVHHNFELDAILVALGMFSAAVIGVLIYSKCRNKKPN